MSSTASSATGFAVGLAEGCDRLVEPAVEGRERARQRRFIGVMLAGPLVLGAAWPAVFGAHLGLSSSVGVLAVAFCAAWAAVVIVASRGQLAGTAAAMLAISSMMLALAIAGAGGLSSPAILVVASLVFEPWWIMRTRRAAGFGLAAAAAALVAQPALSAALALEPTAFAAWHWLVAAAYAAMVVPRVAAFLAERNAGAEQPADRRLDDAIDAIVLRLDRSGDVVEAAGRCDELAGVSPRMLLANGFFDRIHVADRIAYLTALADIRAGASSRTMELRMRVAPGGEEAGGYKPFTAELHAGEPALLVLRDNQAMATLRAELEQTREQAASTDIAKSRFLAAVSHELRTPLNAIIGFSDMLAHEMVGKFADERQRDYAGLIRDSGSHLLAVVNSILDVSKLEAGAYRISPEKFAFAAAASTCHSMLALQAAEKSLRFENHVTAMAGEICCDRRAVQQILINLLSNAVKFTPSGGTVHLDARRTGRRLAITVTDSGIGIAESDLARLGRPFVQVQNDYTRQFEGTGLGLSIAKGLVALHEGTMTIDSAPGDGTIVTVTLPIDGPLGAGERVVTRLPRDGKTEPGEERDAPIRKSA